MGFKIIKAIKVKDEQDIDKHKEFDNADIILFDTPVWKIHRISKSCETSCWHKICFSGFYL